ncbi:MAG: hypothetical protein ABW360_15485 [Phenylobacterium sp.]
MDNDDAIMAGEDDLARAEELAPEIEGAEAEGLEPEDFELELDGQVHTLPAALKGAFLMQADYTRKTQELAEHRRAVEAERKALAEHRRASDGAMSDRAHLAALDDHLQAFAGMDWQAASQSDPRRAQALWAQFQQTQALRERYAQALAHYDERGRLEAAREAAEKMSETGRALQQEIDGWSPEVAAKLVEYAQAFGVTLEELSQMADPRLWKVLHRAYQADQAGQRDAAARAQAVRPAVLVAGSAAGAGGVRDDLGIKDWMARRNEQAMRGR